MLEEKYESRCEVCYKQDREGGGSDRESQNTVFINRRKQKRNPVFADIEKDSYCISLNTIKKLVTKKKRIRVQSIYNK